MHLGFSFHIFSFRGEVNGVERKINSHGGFIMLLICIAAFIPSIPVSKDLGFLAIGAWVLLNGINLILFLWRTGVLKHLKEVKREIREEKKRDNEFKKGEEEEN